MRIPQLLVFGVALKTGVGVEPIVVLAVTTPVVRSSIYVV
jgi:hypothetical protein